MSGYFGLAEPTTAIGHAGEILQGSVWYEGEVQPFLVTLPAPPFTSRAVIELSPDGVDSVSPSWKTKALQAARIAWDQVVDRRTAFRLIIESETPVGRGCGSSTSDCVATIRAVASLYGLPCQSDDIARWTQQAEFACDATMFDLRPVAFLHRRGQVLRTLGQAYPRMRVVTTDLGGPSIDTLSRPLPHYSEPEMRTFENLLEQLQGATARAMSNTATESAAIHQRHYPHSGWPGFSKVLGFRGVLGVACAHSGSVASALLDYRNPAAEEEVIEHCHRLRVPVLARYELAG